MWISSQFKRKLFQRSHSSQAWCWFSSHKWNQCEKPNIVNFSGSYYCITTNIWNVAARITFYGLEAKFIYYVQALTQWIANQETNPPCGWTFPMRRGTTHQSYRRWSMTIEEYVAMSMCCRVSKYWNPSSNTIYKMFETQDYNHDDRSYHKIKIIAVA